MSRNFCVIDIGTNAVKCKIYANGRYYTPKNKFLSNEGEENLNKDEVVAYISEFMTQAKKRDIDEKQIYIAATEGFRTSSNQKEIQEEITRKLGRKVHIVSPQREAWFAVLGGLSSIRFKGKRPKQVVFIESGGGSTEVSLIDTSKRPIKVISTTSLPLGSKRHLQDNDDVKTQKLINKKISDLLRDVKEKGIELDPSLRVVVNSTAASRVIAKQYEQEKYNPSDVAKEQNKMGLTNFARACRSILENDDNEKLMQDYWLQEEVVEGFKGHIYLLKHIFEKLKKRANVPFMSRVPITTTVGGLKDGIMEEIVRGTEEEPEEIERKLFTVGEKTKKKEEKPEKEEKTVEEKEEKSTPEKKKTSEENKSPEEKKIPEDVEWMDEYEDFYKQKNPRYVCTQNKEENTFEVSDGQNKVAYTDSSRVEITNDKDSHSNRLYEDMILLAKEQGIDDIKFEKDVSLETKLRIYAACQKHGMKVQNFIYNPKMLEAVSPETKKIVLSATRKRSENPRKQEIERD